MSVGKKAEILEDYYVYILFRECGTPFYVGKGRLDRWLDHERKTPRKPTHKDHLIAKMKREGIGIHKEKLKEHMKNEDALSLEIETIAAIGRYPNGPLLNATDGGEGHANPSTEARMKISLAKKGIPNPSKGIPRTEEQKQRISLGKIGKLHTQETKDKIRRIRTGTFLSEETKRKCSQSHKGKVFTEEHRINMSFAKMKINLSEETLAKRSASLTGQKRTLEQRARMRASRLAYLEKQKELQNEA